MSTGAKRFLRKAALAALASLLILSILLALPPVQLRLARAIAGTVDGMELELGYLWAGPRGIELENVHLDVPAAGLSLDVAEARIDFAPWSSFLSLGLTIETATLRDVDLSFDLAARAPRAPERAQFVFEGLKPIAELPRWLALGRVDATGNLALRSTEDVEVTGPWKLSAASLMKDQTATVDLAATLNAGRLGETLAAATIDAHANAELDASSRITTFTLAAGVDPTDNQPGLRATAGSSSRPSSSM